MPEQRQEDRDHEATQEGHPVDVRIPAGQIEFSAGIRADGTMQIEWLDQVEEALRKLRPQVEAALLGYAEAELKVVRADPASPQKRNALKTRIFEVLKPIAIKATDAGMGEAVREAVHELIKFLFS